MTMFFALNERFKAFLQRQKRSTFEDTENSVLSSPQQKKNMDR